MKTLKRKTKRFFANRKRWIVAALVFAVFVAAVVFYLGFTGTHKICPWGVVEFPLLALRTGVDLFFVGGVVVGILVLTVALIYPRFFCGWICPLGFLSELLGFVGKVLGISVKKPVPNWLNEKMRIFSYGVVLFIVAITLAKGSMACSLGCPIFWLCAMWKISVPVSAVAALVLWAALSLRVRRGFCRYVCPVGAISGIFSPYSRYVVTVNAEVCTSCGLCSAACPMGIDVQNARFEVKSRHCISCGDCIKSCHFGALSWERRGKFEG